LGALFIPARLISPLETPGELQVCAHRTIGFSACADRNRWPWWGKKIQIETMRFRWPRRRRCWAQRVACRL